MVNYTFFPQFVIESVKFSPISTEANVYKNRNGLLIILEILRLLQREPVCITKVVYRVNLNHGSAEKNLLVLSQRGLVRVVRSASGGTVYNITSKGVELLSEFEHV